MPAMGAKASTINLSPGAPSRGPASSRCDDIPWRSIQPVRGCFGHTGFSTVTATVDSGGGPGWLCAAPAGRAPGGVRACVRCTDRFGPHRRGRHTGADQDRLSAGTGPSLPGVVFRREPGAPRAGWPRGPPARGETPRAPREGRKTPREPPAARQTRAQGWTTNVSTTAMLVYAAGAGITAAAGTRLALQLVLITVFGLHPFQVPPAEGAGGIAAVRCCLTQCFCIGQFARLLPTLVVAAVSQAPSPESNPDSPSPVAATVGPGATV